MTQEEIERATQRLKFLEETESLPPDIIKDLKDWWHEKLYGSKKVLPFVRREDLPRQF